MILQTAGGGRAATRPSVGSWGILVNGNTQYPPPGTPSPLFGGVSFGTGQSTTFSVTVFDGKGFPISASGPAPVAENNTPGGASLDFSWSPDPNDPAGIDWLLTVTCLDAGAAAGTTAIDLIYPLNPPPPAVPPTTVSVVTTPYVLTVALSPLTPGANIVSNDLRNIIATVTTAGPLPVPVPGVTVTSALTIFGAANPGVALQPASAVTTATGDAMFWLTAAIPAGSFRPIGYAYAADFRIGSGAVPGTTRATIPGIVW